jgi:hypothetical protein
MIFRFQPCEVFSMNVEDAKQKLESMSIKLSDESFLTYVNAGDLDVVSLFLDSGISPDVCDSNRVTALANAAKAGQKEVARLLLARGASPEPLLNWAPSSKDGWDTCGKFGLIEFRVRAVDCGRGRIYKRDKLQFHGSLVEINSPTSFSRFLR